MITVSAPGKLMLFGEHAVVYNRPCIVTAVEQRMYATIELLDLQNFELQAPDVNITDYTKPITDLGNGEIPKGAKFVEIAVKNFFEKYNISQGIKITTRSDFSSEFGFGSSSASTVCVVKALSEIFELNLSDKDIFDISYKTVLDIQGKGSGFDVAAAVFGGTLYFVTGGKIIETLDIKNLPLIVGYSGIKADTVTLINAVKELSNKNPQLVESIYNSIEILVNSAKKEIVNQNWEQIGILMSENQKLLQSLGVSIPKLDNMIMSANNAGAYGAKLSGAGGGDCIIVLTPQEKISEVKTSIEKCDAKILNVETNAKGVKKES